MKAATATKKHRQGFKDYAKWCAMLKARPMAATEFQTFGACHRTAAGRFISVMYCEGMLHIADWLMEPGRPTKPRFKFGPGLDVARPLFRPDGREVRGVQQKIYADTAPEVLRFCNALKRLQHMATAKEVSDAVGISGHTTQDLMRYLRAEKMVSIVAWDQGFLSNRWVPSFQLGDAKDVPRPRALSRKEINRRYVERKKQAKAAISLMKAWSFPVAALEAA